MRVIFLNTIARIGGAERCLLTLIKSLRRADDSLDAHLLCFEPGPLLDEAHKLGATTHVVELPRAVANAGEGVLRDPRRLARLAGGLCALPGFIDRLRRTVARIRPDVIHSNNMKTHLLTGGRDLGVPVCWHMHDFVSNRRVMRPMLRAVARRTRVVIAISNAVAEDVRRVLPRARVEVVHNAVDLDRYFPGVPDEQIFGPADGSVRVGLAATYARWKGQDVFLRAVARVPRELHARFFIIGGPIYQTAGSQFTRDELKSLAEASSVVDRVTFLPFQSDMPAVYRALDIVVHASTQPEPFGLTIAEAMACGRSVIAIRAGGAQEIFDDGKDALGAEMKSEASLAAAMERLIKDADLRNRLAEAAAASARSKFHSDRLGVALIQIYRSCL